MKPVIKEDNENMNTEDSVENTTVKTTVAERTAVKEVKEETEETEDPLLVIPGQGFKGCIKRGVGWGDSLNEKCN